MKEDKEQKPSHHFDYLIKNGMNEEVALEIDLYTQHKEKRKKRMMDKDKKEKRWK